MRRAWNFGVGVLAVLAATVAGTAAISLVNAPRHSKLALGVAISVGLAASVAWLARRAAVRSGLLGEPRGARSAPAGTFAKELGAFAMVTTLLAGMGSSCDLIEPGHVGIEVDLYGKDRGVQDYPIVSGMVWYNPLTTRIFSYPTYVQTAVWTANLNEGRPLNEEISFNSREGLVITADVSLSYQLEAAKVPAFYVKFRSDDLNQFTHGFLRNVARDAFSAIAPNFTAEEIYGAKKEEFLARVGDRIDEKVHDLGVNLQQFGFIGAPRLPGNVVEALNAKIRATQDAIRVENELRQAEAEAKKRIAAAQGEAEANRILSSSLSPTLLEWRRLELVEASIRKWDGALPKYTSGDRLPFIGVPTEREKQ
jgi:regulator of protease activity HflC (stomatin/prohibitin superfamily)